MMRRSPGLCRAVLVLVCALAITLRGEESRSATPSLEVSVASAAVADDPVALIFPQIADGGGNRTQLLLTNASETATTTTISFYSDTGTPLNLTIDGSTSSSFQVLIPAHGSAKVATTGAPESALIGWARVTANPPADLSGNAVFQSYRGTSLYSEASIPGVLPISSMDFFADEEDGFRTGFALANAGAGPAEGTLTLRRRDGTIFRSSPISIAPGNHMAAFLWQILGEDIPSGSAELRLSAGYLAATAVRYHTSSVFSGLPVGQPGYAAAGATALFSPKGGVRARLMEEIDKAGATIDIAIYSFTADTIRDALINARNRGVQIRIIADSSQANDQGSEIATLEQLGFQLKRSAGASGGIMHNKFMIIDGMVLFTGSYNWSASAEDSNYENAVFIQGSTVIQGFLAEFNHIWGR